MKDKLRDIWNDEYSKGKEAGRREVLEKIDKELINLGDSVDTLQINHANLDECWKVDVLSLISKLQETLKDLTSDPQTSSPQVASDNPSHKSPAEEGGQSDSSSEGCGFEFICFDKGRMGRRTKCGKDGYFCDGCKQKQEKKK